MRALRMRPTFGSLRAISGRYGRHPPGSVGPDLQLLGTRKFDRIKKFEVV